LRRTTVSIKEKFFHALGLKPKVHIPAASVTRPANLDDLQALAPASHESTKPAPPTVEPGTPLRGISTDDLDPTTWRLRDDYEARRLRRAEPPGPAELEVLPDVFPNNRR
jgi:hypothetical protein